MKKIINISFISLFILFFSFIANYYFSEKNKIQTNKNRSSYPETLKKDLLNVPLLKNDTKNIIEYKNEIEKYKKKKKYTFWDLIKKSDD